ncbi:hypothetical protein SDC9_169933 [bioreactor metagenome]|uniref:Uncharacterized protein n=1 Tax=bioreactor metagenome TaxID=1076179 RepID=A0A645G970_9ZZZZ
MGLRVVDQLFDDVGDHRLVTLHLGNFEVIDVVDDTPVLGIDDVDSSVQLAFPNDRHVRSPVVAILVPLVPCERLFSGEPTVKRRPSERCFETMLAKLWQHFLLFLGGYY